jgi:hypothetical protein
MAPRDSDEIPVQVVLREAEQDLHAAIRYKTTLERVLVHGSGAERERAARTLARIALDYPEEVHRSLRTAVKAAVDDDIDSVRGNSSAIVAALAGTYPKDVAGYIGTIERGLTDPHPTVVENVAETFAFTTRASPQGALDALDDLGALLESNREPVRRHATIAMYNVGRAYPERIVRFDDRLVTRLATDTDEITRIAAAGALAQVAKSSPDRFADWVDDLESLLRTETDERVQGNVVAVLARLGESDPEAIRPTLDTLSGLLSSSDHTTLVNVTDAIGHVAAIDPTAVRAADIVPKLRRLWDRTDSATLRANVSEIVRQVSDADRREEPRRRTGMDDPLDIPSSMLDEILRLGRESTRQVILDIETFIDDRSERNDTTVEVQDSVVGDLDARGRSGEDERGR